MLGSSTCQKIVREGQNFDNLLFGTSRHVSCLLYRRSVIATFSDEACDKLEDPDTQKWLPFRTTLQGVLFFQTLRDYLRNFKQIGKT